jgi:hypothetical protein
MGHCQLMTQFHGRAVGDGRDMRGMRHRAGLRQSGPLIDICEMGDGMLLGPNGREQEVHLPRLRFRIG